MNLQTSLLFLSFTGALFFFSPAMSTDRFYSDLSASSENGKYQLIARSPDNRRVMTIVDPKQGSADPFGSGEEENLDESAETKHQQKPFSDSFNYTLYESVEGKAKEIWHRPYRKGDYAPTKIDVSNKGQALVSDGRFILIIDSKGRDRNRVDLFTQVFTPDERREKVEWTTAGSRWDDYSLRYFLPLSLEEKESLYYVIETWWGRTVLIDMDSCRPINELRKPFQKTIAKETERSVIQILKEASKELPEWAAKDGCFDYDQLAQYKAAIFQSAYTDIDPKAIIPLLHELEKIEYFDVFGGGVNNFEPKKEGEPDISDFSQSTLRKLIHFALRKNGALPKKFPCCKPRAYHNPYQQKDWPLPTISTEDKTANAVKINQSMTPQQVLELLGGPDYILNSALGYFIDAIEPYSLELRFEEGIVSAKVLTYPPHYQGNRNQVKDLFR